MAARPVRSLKVVNWERWQSYRSDRGHASVDQVVAGDATEPGMDLIRRCTASGQLVQIWILSADKEGKIESPPGVELATFIRRVCCMESDPDLQLLESLKFIKCRETPQRRQRDAS